LVSSGFASCRSRIFARVQITHPDATAMKGLTRRCSELLAAPRSSFLVTTISHAQPRAVSPAVADLVSR
jgi:hypothetical protein